MELLISAEWLNDDKFTHFVNFLCINVGFDWEEEHLTESRLEGKHDSRCAMCVCINMFFHEHLNELFRLKCYNSLYTTIVLIDTRLSFAFMHQVRLPNRTI